MHTVVLLLFLPVIAFNPPLFKEDKGEAKAGGRVFVEENGIWVDQELPPGYKLEKSYVVIHKSPEWGTWNKGSAELKEILALGPNVVFYYKGKDGKNHVYAVFKNKKLAAAAVKGGPEAIKAGLGGAAGKAGVGLKVLGGGTLALGAAAVVVANNDGDEEDCSCIRR